jgi:hypothetical protein
MTARRRRKRRPDPLASVATIRAILDRVAARANPASPASHKEIIRMLRAASHCERVEWRSSRRGRRPHFSRAVLRTVWTLLGDELARETHSSVSARTFTEHYLRLLACPQDIIEAIQDGRINLFEALQLARIKPSTTGLSSSGAARLRSRALAAHITGQGSARQLYERVSSLLTTKDDKARTSADRSATPDDAYDGADVDAEVEAYIADPGALFADQLRQVSMALAQLDASSIGDDDVTAILDLLDQLYLRVVRAARRAPG